MKNDNMRIFEELFQYGFHDTEISSIETSLCELRLNFNNGIYLLNEACRETTLTKPLQLKFQITPAFFSEEYVVNVTSYGKKTKYYNYSDMKKKFQKSSFEVVNVYFSPFNAVLFDGGMKKESMLFYIDFIEKVTICELPIE